MYRTPRLSNFPLIWRRNRVRFYLLIDGKTVCRLWKEVQIGVFHLSSTSSGHCGNILMKTLIEFLDDSINFFTKI